MSVRFPSLRTHPLFTKFRQLIQNTNGNVMVMVASLMLPIFSLAGGGIDIGQAYMLREKLQETIDSATLHGVKFLNQGTALTEVQRFIDLNFPPNVSTGLTLSPASITEDLGEKILTVEVTGTLNTSFLRLAGLNTLTLKVQAKAQLTGSAQEIVIVADNTGSMSQDPTAEGTITDCTQSNCNKMKYMKYAISKYIDSLSTGGQLNENVYVGLVPYTATVNIGANRSSWTTGTAGLNFGASGWRGCVMGRHSQGNDMTDEPPSTEAFVPYRWPSTFGTIYYKLSSSGSGSIGSPSTYNGELVIGDNNWVAGNETDTLAGNKTYKEKVLGPNLNCGPEITPLTNDYASLKHDISLFNAFNRGGSMLLMGIGWAYNMVSPKWRGLWEGDTPSDLPKDYGGQSSKTIIIIADGDNTWSDWNGYEMVFPTNVASNYIPNIGQAAWNAIVNYWNNGSGFCCIWVGAPGFPVATDYPDSDFTGYGRRSQAIMGTTNASNAAGVANSRMSTLCTNMKNNGITIHGIAYGSDATASVKSTLASCASPGKYT